MIDKHTHRSKANSSTTHSLNQSIMTSYFTNPETPHALYSDSQSITSTQASSMLSPNNLSTKTKENENQTRNRLIEAILKPKLKENREKERPSLKDMKREERSHNKKRKDMSPR